MTLHRRRAGQGAPLLLVHGLGSDLHAWDPVFERLAEHHDVVAVDLPGFGRSPVPDGDIDVAALVDGVEAELDALGWSRPHVVGNSLGGLVAFGLARRGRAATVVALSPAGGASRWEDLLARVQLRAARAAAKAVAPVASSIARSRPARLLGLRSMVARPDQVNPDWFENAIRSYAAAPAFGEVLDRIDLEQERDDLADVPCRVRIAWGTRDRLLLPRQARRLVERLPDAELVWMEGLGHVPMVDDPEAVARVILEVTAI